MASLIDSEAQFKERVKHFRLSDPVIRGLGALSLNTIGVFAYCHGQPGQPINDEEFQKWIEANVVASVSVSDLAGLKRLLFESQTLVLAALKEQVTAPESASSRPVPSAERESRLEAIRTMLPGILIEGPLEPSHTLLNACAAMQQANEVRYIAPEKCVSRTHEVIHQKNPSKQLEISSDVLAVREHREVPDAVTTSALQVQEALVRRGIGLVFADLVDHASYSKYISTLFSHLHREPPAGSSRCSVSQIVNADKLVWQKLLELGTKPRRGADGTLALNKGLLEALVSYEVSFTLLPLPSKKEPKVNLKKNPKNEVLKDKIEKKGKGKGKGKIPDAIRKLGGVARDPDGNNICFAFNISSCSEAAIGAKCRRGAHICAKCFGLHSVQDHDKE